MKRQALSIVLCALCASAAATQAQPPLEGVWKIVEILAPGVKPDQKGAAPTNSSPEPNLIIFTKHYYSAVVVTAWEPRAAVPPAKDPQHLSESEKLARYEQWRQFAANSGTYELKGTTLVRHPTVAESVDAMSPGREIVDEFRLEGRDTLWLIPIGERAVMKPRIRLERLE